MLFRGRRTPLPTAINTPSGAGKSIMQTTNSTHQREAPEKIAQRLRDVRIDDLSQFSGFLLYLLIAIFRWSACRQPAC
jgi:hypothetical protein